jgi:hypothetical protein
LSHGTVRNSVYPIRFAVESKNEVKAVGAPHIGEFISKLEAVGIAFQILKSERARVWESIADNYVGMPTEE